MKAISYLGVLSPCDGRTVMLETFPVFLPITHLLLRELEPEKEI